jgi:hypothetical protein
MNHIHRIEHKKCINKLPVKNILIVALQKIQKKFN